MTISVRRRIYAPPVFRSFMALAGLALLGGCLTDIAYVVSEDFIWADGSDWLVTVGAALGFIALLLALIELLLLRRTIAPPARLMLAGSLAWLVSIGNALVHTRDSYTSVYPWGLALSALTAVLIVIAFASARRATIPNLVPEEYLA